MAPPTPSGDDEGRPDLLTRLLTRLRDLLSPGIKNVVGFPQRERSQSAARDRLEAIRAHEPPWSPFSERPPGSRELTLERDEPDRSRVHAFLLQWQSQADELLLLARAADVVVLGLRNMSTREGASAIDEVVERVAPVVAIRPLPALLRLLRPRLFPWRVVVSTRRPDLVRVELAQFGDWLGIGVDIEKGASVGALGRCVVGGGLEGTVGGTLRDSAGHEMLVTCRHILAPGCRSKVWLPAEGGARVGISDEPDAALLDPGACLAAGGRHTVGLDSASHQQLSDLLASGRPVIRVGGARSGAEGVIQLAPERVSSPAAMLAPDGLGGVTRFPLVVITRRRRRFRPNRSPFSSSGDSGSWVVEPEQRTWIGMVVSGNEDLTLAVSASCLLGYLTALEPGPLAMGDVECLTTL